MSAQKITCHCPGLNCFPRAEHDFKELLSIGEFLIHDSSCKIIIPNCDTRLFTKPGSLSNDIRFFQASENNIPLDRFSPPISDAIFVTSH